jgi:hypothetical protein
MILLGILYLIDAYTSDGKHKESQQQQQQGQQCGEQPECQSTTSAYSWACTGYASAKALDSAADHGQHASYPTSSTKPPTFSHAMEPMDADDWLMSVEKKLQVVQCNNHEKVLLACHQLSGPAFDWWDAYVEAHEEPESINWLEFRAAFRAHHVP